MAEAELPGGRNDTARSLYQMKCLKCHKHYNPARYDAQAWRVWMDKMTVKAHLRPEESRLIRDYLDRLRHAASASQSLGDRPRPLGDAGEPAVSGEKMVDTR